MKATVDLPMADTIFAIETQLRKVAARWMSLMWRPTDSRHRCGSARSLAPRLGLQPNVTAGVASPTSEKPSIVSVSCWRLGHDNYLVLGLRYNYARERTCIETFAVGKDCETVPPSGKLVRICRYRVFGGRGEGMEGRC